MVLDNATTATEIPFSDTLPTSDIDPYATCNPPYTATGPGNSSFIPVNSPGPNQIYVNLDQLPQTWLLLGKGSRSPEFAKSIQESCRFAASALRRPLKQEEADALAYHFAHSVRLGSLGTPVGVTLASIQHYRGRRTYRFPGWNPFTEGSRFSPEVFGALRGQAARTAWQIARGVVYWSVGGFLGQIFFGAYALSVAVAGRSMDPRLGEFMQVLKVRSREAGGLEVLRRAQDENGTTQGETFEQGRQRRAVQQAGVRSRQQQQVARGKESDDMSPTGGAFGSEYGDSSSDTGFMSDEQMRQQEIGQRADSRPGTTQSRDITFDISKVGPQQPSSSRTTSNQSNLNRSSTDQSPSPRQSSGSAWDRLRQGAMTQQSKPGDSRASQASRTSGLPTRVQGEQKASSTGGDGFDFSESDEERQLARSEAQRQFDERAEREREGREFDDGGIGNGKRW